jgi:queuine tRNA-ribosyltransferase
VPPPADGSTRARSGGSRCRTASWRRRSSCPSAPTPRSRRSTPTTCATGGSIILANTYHLYLRPGHERIERLGGLHRFMGWDRPILTDSGGFQVVSLGDLRVVDEDGVTFRSTSTAPSTASRPSTPSRSRRRSGSDIAVAFDQPVRPRLARREVADATERTHRWAERSLAPTAAGPGALRHHPGRPGPDLRARVDAAIAGLPFDGICIGGLAGDETPAAAGRGAGRGGAAAGWRPAAALPDGPRLARRPARGRPRGWTCSTRCCRRAWRATAAVGPRRPPQPPQRAVPR